MTLGQRQVDLDCVLTSAIHFQKRCVCDVIEIFVFESFPTMDDGGSDARCCVLSGRSLNVTDSMNERARVAWLIGVFGEESHPLHCPPDISTTPLVELIFQGASALASGLAKSQRLLESIALPCFVCRCDCVQCKFGGVVPTITEFAKWESGGVSFTQSDFTQYSTGTQAFLALAV